MPRIAIMPTKKLTVKQITISFIAKITKHIMIIKAKHPFMSDILFSKK